MFDNNPFREYKKMIQETTESSKKLLAALHSHYETRVGLPYENGTPNEKLDQDRIVDAAHDYIKDLSRVNRAEGIEIGFSDLIKYGKNHINTLIHGRTGKDVPPLNDEDIPF